MQVEIIATGTPYDGLAAADLTAHRDGDDEERDTLTLLVDLGGAEEQALALVVDRAALAAMLAPLL